MVSSPVSPPRPYKPPFPHPYAPHAQPISVALKLPINMKHRVDAFQCASFPSGRSISYVSGTVIYGLLEARGRFRDRHHEGIVFYRNVLSCCWNTISRNTGCFVIFSAITNIYKKKTEGPNLMELFTATEKLKKIFLTTIYVRCVHHMWHGTQRYDIQVLATHASTWVPPASTDTQFQ